MLPEEILNSAHKSISIPILILNYIIVGLVFLVVGLISIDSKRSGYGKFMMIWAISMFIIGIFFIWIVFSPNTIQAIADLFR